jgi:colanic acid biosynthesis glycosyl transferase WcaI
MRAATGSIHVISQHFPPDQTSTAKYVAAVAEELSEIADVTAVTGTADPQNAGRLHVSGSIRIVELKNRQTDKGKLVLRAWAMTMFALRVLHYCLFRTMRHDIVVAVTTPYTVTFAVGLAARLTGRRAVLMLYDLYPDVLVQAGLIKRHSLPDRLLAWLNRRLLKGYRTIVVIGRDMERRVGAYVDLRRTTLTYIPMWSDVDAELVPTKSNPAVQRYRPSEPAVFTLALSGNLGFTHDPETVFEAARQLAGDARIHFLLSGWGVGWKRLKALQAQAGLPNVTMTDAVPEAELGAFLMAGDLWMIPYRSGMTGVSVPSRFYNLLALGKPIITLAEPQADHSTIINDAEIGWVVPPGDVAKLAATLRAIADAPEVLEQRGKRAVEIARRYTRATCGAAYRDVVRALEQRS